jgi:putative ABC transport system ATP-binding protein
VLLADEPNANRDSQNGREVAALMRSLALAQGLAVMVVTHDDRLRTIADRILHLEDGRVAATTGGIGGEPA